MHQCFLLLFLFVLVFSCSSNIHATRTWVWVAGPSAGASYPATIPATKSPFRAFSANVAPGSSIQGGCLVYSNLRHQLILLDSGINGVWLYDISKAMWAILWDNRYQDQTSVFDANTPGDETSEVTGPSPIFSSACALDPNEIRIWVFGGRTWDGQSYIDSNQLWSFNLHTFRWAWWYGSRTTQTTNYTTETLGYRYKANIAFQDAGRQVLIMNGFDRSYSPIYDVWQYNVTSKNMSLVTTLPLIKTAYNAGGFLGAVSVPSAVNLPPTGYESTFYVQVHDGSIYQGFNDDASFVTKFYTISGPTAWHYAPLSGNLSTSEPVYTGGRWLEIYSKGYLPNTRKRATIFSNRFSDDFAVFGGYSTTGRLSFCDDFWIFDTKLAQWSLVWGDPICNATMMPSSFTANRSQISPSSTPGFRADGLGVLDRNGVFWFFGGMSVGKHWADLWVLTKTDCEAGSYFNFTDYVCRVCPIDTFTAYVNNNAACQPCPANSTTSGLPGASRCSCSNGLVGDPHDVFTGCKPYASVSTASLTTPSISSVAEWEVPISTATETTSTTTEIAMSVHETSSETLSPQEISPTSTTAETVKSVHDSSSETLSPQDNLPNSQYMSVSLTSSIQETWTSAAEVISNLDATVETLSSTTLSFPRQEAPDNPQNSNSRVVLYAALGGSAGAAVILLSAGLFIVHKRRELLRAKQVVVEQGTLYPTTNPFAGDHNSQMQPPMLDSQSPAMISSLPQPNMTLAQTTFSPSCTTALAQDTTPAIGDLTNLSTVATTQATEQAPFEGQAVAIAPMRGTLAFVDTGLGNTATMV